MKSTDRVQQLRHVQRDVFALGRAFPGSPSKVQARRRVRTVDLLVVPLRVAAPKGRAAFPEATAGPLFDQLGQCGD
jgi:hypothetical protein